MLKSVDIAYIQPLFYNFDVFYMKKKKIVPTKIRTHEYSTATLPPRLLFFLKMVGLIMNLESE
jgi:hypothetical protein